MTVQDKLGTTTSRGLLLNAAVGGMCLYHLGPGIRLERPSQRPVHQGGGQLAL